MANVERLAGMTETGRPWTRLAFSGEHREARAWLAVAMRDLGMSTSIDAGGNLIGSVAGKCADLPPLSTGSHSDTVAAGGRFDGAAGLVAGLEVVAALRGSGVRLRHTFEVIDFLAEEPNQYGLSCVGSRAMTGQLTPDQLARRSADGSSLSDGIRWMGGDPDRLGQPLRVNGDVAAFVELHIEQGRVLESAGHDIGVVTGIAGIRRHLIVITGQADHAGATPMELRRDALVAASAIISRLDELARDRARWTGPLVATVGRLEIEPNAANVVPGRVSLVLEVRSLSDDSIEAFLREATRTVEAVTRERDLACVIDDLSASKAVLLDTRVRSAIAEAASGRGWSTRDMPSGAGHDAANMARCGPAGMIFVPCRLGRSHCPEEWTEPDQLARGAQVLLDAVVSLDS